MKKFLFLLLLLFPVFGSAYQQQGFKEYTENVGTSNFVCEGQCVILIGPTDQYDMISLDGQINGQGVLGYGFLVGQQIIPGEIIQINGSSAIQKDFVFSRAQAFKQIPPGSQIMIIIEGKIQGNIKPSIDVLGLGQKVTMGFKDFRTMETLTPYSINLRYGVKILGTSILAYGYRIFIIITIYILIFSKDREKRKFQKIFFLGIGIFIFIGIRNFITYTRIVDKGIKSYSSQTMDNKTFFDLGDYITFTDKIRKELKLENKDTSCKIKINSFQERPFKVHRDSLYLKPCIGVMTGSDADYILYYKKPIATQDLQKQVIIDFNGSYLLQNK